MTYFFFYGIFRGNTHNNPFAGCNYLGPAKAPGFVITRSNGAASMVPGRIFTTSENAVAKGTIRAVHDDLLPRILQHLDRCEGNGHFYIRAKIEVILEDGQIIEAYAYLSMADYDITQVEPDGHWRGYNGYLGNE